MHFFQVRYTVVQKQTNEINNYCGLQRTCRFVYDKKKSPSEFCFFWYKISLYFHELVVCGVGCSYKYEQCSK